MSKMRLSDKFSMLLKIACDFKRFIYLLSNFNILSAVFCRTLCNLAVCPQPIKNIVTAPSFARTCESRITSKVIIPREARPKASRSGVYNFVPQRAQAG